MAVSPQGKPRPRTGSRVAAVQALFQAEQGPTSPETVIDEFIRFRLGAVAGSDGFEDGRVHDVDVKLFARIVRAATVDQDRIDTMVSDALAADWPMDRLDPVLRALMRAGAAAERALELALAELIPLPEGISPERLPLPFHAPPAWTDSTGFVPALDELIKEGDLGALAALRMSLQVVPAGIAPEARAYVEPLLPPQASRRVRQVYFLVAALRAVHRDQDRGVSLGRAMRRIHEALGDRLDRAGGTAASERFEALLAAHPNEVGTLVSAALPLVYEHGALDWERLLHDLIFWTRRDRLVQRALARDFYATPSVPPTPVEVP